MNANVRHAGRAGETRQLGFVAEYPGKPSKDLGETGQVATRPIDYAQRQQAARTGRVQPAGTVQASCAIGGLHPPYSADRTCEARA